MVIKCKGFIVTTKVYGARKGKSDISTHEDMIKTSYDLLKEGHIKKKDTDVMECACTWINCSMGFLQKIAHLIFLIHQKI